MVNLYNTIFTGSEQALSAAKAMLVEAINNNGREYKRKNNKGNGTENNRSPRPRTTRGQC